MAIDLWLRSNIWLIEEFLYLWTKPWWWTHVLLATLWQHLLRLKRHILGVNIILLWIVVMSLVVHILICLLLQNVPKVILQPIKWLWKIHTYIILYFVKVRQTTDLSRSFRSITERHKSMFVFTPSWSEHFVALIFMPYDLVTLQHNPASYTDILRITTIIIWVNVPYKWLERNRIRQKQLSSLLRYKLCLTILWWMYTTTIWHKHRKVCVLLFYYFDFYLCVKTCLNVLFYTLTFS